MITAIISLAYVHGAELWLVGWLACAWVYFIVLLLPRINRSRVGIKNVLFWFLAAEFVTDLTWALIYYDNTGYLNYGVGAVYGLILWPVVLLVGGIAATLQNRRNFPQ